MSRFPSLDIAAASRLAGLDPALAQLARALPQPTTGSQWELHDVRWTPGQGCRLAYQVRRPGGVSTFVAVDVDHEGFSRHDYRDDPALPGLESAADPAWAAALLAPRLADPVRRFRIEPVRYRPGSRCVLRYDVETAAGTSRFYAKVFGPGRFAEVARLGTALAADGCRLVPEMVAVSAGSQVVVVAATHGRSVSAVIGDPAVPAAERARLGHGLGELLATFHRQHEVAAPRWSASDQVAALAAAIPASRSGDAFLAGRLGAVLDTLAARLPSAGPEVLAHGGFRAGQVIVSDDGRLTVLDTDGVCRCDPGRDLGTALAHLLWQVVRQPEQQLAFRAAGRALLPGYESRAGTVDPQALLWWRAAGLLLVAVRRYRRLEVSDWRFVPALADMAAELLDTPRLRTLGPTAGPPRTLAVESADAFATTPGRRAVVRYTVRGLDGPDPVRVVGKTFTESRRARLLHEHLRLLHDGPFRDGELRVPEPLGLVLEQRLVLYRHCDGTPLDLVTEPRQVEEGVRRAARWLAQLHRSDVRLPRTLSLSQEEASTRRWAADIGRHRPDLATRARWLADRWAAAARAAGPEVEVALHKDFHPGHVLVGDHLYVIDLDEARQGDPTFDVAHFCCYLDRGDTGAAGEPFRAAFLQEYAGATGWTDPGTFVPFCAYTWLKIAKQATTGGGPFRKASTPQRIRAAERALAKGHACLIA